ncbi:prolyl oligopeptidase family serine peptidase [Glaciecola sp. MH2013]|uniref:alpha/beta hydrolase family protein n=1 Tax=Glaciecola sp. MH2013 TaxID=2785524 RepID=UPI00189E97EB|nr:prolyl oligopeptidase family serine peptidase [Glaciecola sp. MH2013]MBF7073528.1 prolyl oligopeptidase family serine peptidase [Glaciecola sp. MH2013]
MKKRAKDEKEFKRRSFNFKQMFPRAKYEDYKERIDCIIFTYKVNGEEVKGYALRPKGSAKLPIIFYNRGGNGNFGAVVFGAKMARLMPLAEQGFIVVGSQYRGTMQQGGLFKDEFGGADVDDVVSLVHKLKYLKNANNDAIGMYGSSRGGMQTMLALKELQSTVKTAVLSAGNYDLLNQIKFRPEMEMVYEKRIPNYATQKEAQLKARSALCWSEEIDRTIPILLQHGTLDKRVNVQNSIALAKKFEETQRPHQLSLYENDDHGLRKNKEAADKEVIEWFKERLR